MRYVIAIAAVMLASPAAGQSITIAPLPAWRACAVEDGICPSRAGALVRYGAGASYVHRVVNGAIRCDNATFGDPIVGTPKTCDIASPAAVAVTKPTPTPSPTPVGSPVATGRAALGVNVGGLAYWAAEQTFANQATALEWRDPAGGWGYVAADQMRAGVPISVTPGRPLLAYLTPPAAAWQGKAPETRCTWSGTGTVTIGGASVSSTAGRAITFRWPASSSPIQTVSVSITATDAADPVRDIDCREPGDTGIFAAQLLDYLKPFGVLRFLDWSNANGNPSTVTWATRGRTATNITGGSDGFALEYQIGLANAVGASPWFTVPLNADADYQRRMAQMVHDQVPAGRPVYVELSNEVWNYQFGQTRQAEAEGVAAKLSENGFMAALYRYGQRITEVMPIWAAVFADRPADLIRVAATQSGNPWAGQVLMEWNGSAVAKHIDAIAIAPYFFVDAAVLTDDHDTNMRLLAEAADREIAGSVKAYRALADKYGKRLVAYEGGQHMLDRSDPARRVRMQRDPRMTGIYSRYLAGWRAAGGGTFMLYSATGPISEYGAWGLREYAGQPLTETPKLRGVLTPDM